MISSNLTIRPAEIASVWIGYTDPGVRVRVVVTHKSGAKTSLNYPDESEALRDYDLLGAAMQDREAPPMSVGARNG